MTNNTIHAKILRKIWNHIKEYFYFLRVTDSPLVLNINNDCTSNQKKIVIFYVTHSYFKNLENTSFNRTQAFEIFKIVGYFISLGYSIDIIGCNDIKALDIIKTKKYDLIFGFGEAFYQLTNIQPDVISILYMTENHPEFSYKEELKRLDYYYERHGRKLDITRSGKFYKIYHLEKRYSQIITMSETEPIQSQYNRPYTIFPTGLINLQYNFKVKDHLHSRKHFLWLGSTGAIHKGLDLLLDVFDKQEDIVIHICGLENPDRKQLSIKKKKNIIEYGHININSDIFLEITNKCSFIILPSCSEACSTSITTGMLHALIPIVIKDTGFNRLGNNAIFLDDYNIDYLTTKLTEFSNMDPENLAILSRQIYEFARQKFTISYFGSSFKKIMDDILNIKETNSK